MNMIRYAIIVAGGSGSRFKREDNSENAPKQFSLLMGKPVLMRTIQSIHNAGEDIRIIVVLPEKDMEAWQLLCQTYNFDITHTITAGGKTRFASVKNGLAFIQEPGIVAVHDGVRPLASAELIKRCFHEA